MPAMAAAPSKELDVFRFCSYMFLCFVMGLMFWLLSGPLGFNCWISFAPVLNFMTFESLSLLCLLFIS